MSQNYKMLVCLAVFILIFGVGQAGVLAQESALAAADASAYFGQVAEARGFSGAVLIVQDGEVILREGYGLADDVAQTPVTPETVFDVGSLAKQFTAAAILRLQAEGLLSVEDTLSTYFDDIPGDISEITIHQLLTHSSGLSEHADDDLEPLSRDEALDIIFKQSLLFEPGTSYTYSNSGYTLLAAIIEQVSGQAYTDYLRENLFALADLQHTGFYNDARWSSLTVANGYWNEEDQGSPATWPGPYWTVMGNGGILSTVDDLYLWWSALQNNTILPAEQTALLFEPHVLEDGGESYYGYGWSIADTEYGHKITHNGGGIGGNSDLAVYTDRDLLLITLSNRIVYQDAFGIPCRVEVLATEANEQLIRNITTGDFSITPEASLAVC
jgi:CubicO group peptidase (beta-lactamase class C family)